MHIHFRQIDCYLENNLSHLYFFLIGDDFGQIICSTEKILEKYFNKEAYNIEKIEYSDLEKNPLLLHRHLQSIQLFSQKKAIIIYNVNNIFKKDIIDIIKSSNSKFLLLIQTNNVKKSSQTYKNFESINQFCLIHCYKLDLNSVKNFIEQFFKKNNITFTTQVIEIITSSLPNNLLIIKNELEKITTYLGHKKNLTIDTVNNIISGIQDPAYINICYAIVMKNKSCLLKEIEKVVNVNYINIIRIIQGYFSTVLSIKYKEKHENKMIRLVINEIKPPIFFKDKEIILDICNNITLDQALLFMEDLIALEINCKESLTHNQHYSLYYYLIYKMQSICL